MVNKANVRKVIDLVNSAPMGIYPDDALGFGMAGYYHDCGTPMCLVGFTDAARFGLGYADKADENSLEDEEFSARADFLGIPTEEAWRLYHPDQSLFPWDTITKEQAIAVLAWLAQSGEVDWSVALPEVWESLKEA